MVEWRESRERIALTSTVFGSANGVFVRVQVDNPFREARSVSLHVTLRGRCPLGPLEMSGSGLVTPEGTRLLDVTGAKASPTISRRGREEAAVGLEVVLPSRGKRVVKFVLEPAGGTRAHSLDSVYAETLAAWEVPRGTLAVCRLPDGELQAAFDRAWYTLAGSIVSRAGDRGSHPWPRPGLEAGSGPATLDVLALRALDEWGGGRMVENCLEWLLETQGSAAPPGDSFGSARGFLSLPPEENPRERWGSDCGALLWATCARGDVGARKGWFRSIRRSVEEACAWITGELGAGENCRDGLMPDSRGPRILGRAARAWNDAWSWRGLDAAAGMLEELGVPSAGEVRAAADRYREAATMAHGDSREGRECLERLGVTARPEGDERVQARRFRSLYEWAEELASASLTPEGEFRTAVFFLRTLRRLLIREEEYQPGGSGKKTAALHIFPGTPPAWFEEGARLEIERLPTSAGPVTVRAMRAPGGERLIVEAELPGGAPQTALHLGEGRLGEVRVNGRRWRARETPRSAARRGLVWLPKGGGQFDVSAEIAGRFPPRRSQRRKTRPK